MRWNVYQLERERDLGSQVGMKEKLTLVPINGTVPSYTQLQLNMPARALDLGLYKLVFKFEVRFILFGTYIIKSMIIPLDIDWTGRCKNI